MNSEALAAVITGNVENLKKLLSEGAVKNINAQDDNGLTLLHHATIKGFVQIIQCLLEHSAIAFIRDQNTFTVLHLVVLKWEDSVVNMILSHISRDQVPKLINAKIEISGFTGFSALHIAAKFDSFASAMHLLKYGANFELTNKDGEKPIDLTSPGKLRDLLLLIDSIFVKANRGDVKLMDDLKRHGKQCELELLPIVNCKNNDGHTLMHIIMRREYNELALELLMWRLTSPIDLELAALNELDRQSEVDKLAELTRECHDFWKIRQSDMGSLIRVASNKFDATQQLVKIACGMLEKVHEVLLAFREFEGNQKFIPSNLRMWALEELFEILYGIDPTKRLCVDGSQEHCYYVKLPKNWKNFVFLMALLDVIHTSIDYFLEWINRIRVFCAVKNDDVNKVQQLIKKHPLMIKLIDASGRTVLCHAVEQGNKKMVRKLLKAGAKMIMEEESLKVVPQDLARRWKSSFYVAVDKGNVKVVKLLLENTDMKNIAEMIDAPQDGDESTPLHAAARLGRLDIVKLLLKYGAAYWILDAKVRTPMEVSTNEEVTQFLKLVDDCFQNAKKANVELVHKLKAMEIEDFMAVAGTKNHDDQTLAVVAAKANAKNIAGMILRMIREVKQNEK